MSLNVTMVVLAGVIVLLMQAGLALVSVGLCRAKHAAQVISMNLVVFALSILGFWVCGYALFAGGNGEGGEWSIHLFGAPFGLAGHHGFFLSDTNNPASMARFLFEAVAFSVAAAIPLGAMAERWRFKMVVPYAIIVGAAPLALFGNWVSNEGWLGLLGRHLGMGHGFVDFAGSSYIHMAGGVIGLMGAMALGPRVGKYSRDGRPRPMPGHNLMCVVSGSLLMATGWLALNIGPAFFGDAERMPLIAVNTLLAASAGAGAAYAVVIWKFRKPDPSMICNGLLAGLAGISAGGPYLTCWGAVLTGIVAGILAVYAVLFFEGTVKVDDPSGVLSVHGVGGAWGALSLGLLANGSYGVGLNGVQLTGKNGAPIGVAGIIGGLFGSPEGDWSQLGAQVIGTAACLIFFGLGAWLWFKACALFGPLRSRHEDEVAGLDLPELGAECYPDFHLTDKGSTRGE